MYEWKASRLKVLRESLGLTQEQVAVKTGKKVQQISIWENGVNKPTIDNLLEICNALETAPSFFFDDVSTLVEETPHEVSGGSR